MKKWIAMALCLMLLTGCAFAEETVRMREIVLEGITEEVTETLYQSEAGFGIWYPSEYLTAGEKYGRPCFYPVGAGEESEIYFLMIPADANPADAEGLLAEAVGGFGADAVISEAQWTTTESGALLGSVQAEQEGVIYRYYLATNDEDVLMITASFPVEAAEGFGVRFDRMAETISFSQITLNARYEGEGYAVSYPAELLTYAEVVNHDGFVPVERFKETEAYLMIVKSNVAPEHTDVMLNEALGGYDASYAITYGEGKILESGLEMHWAQAELDGRIDRYYLIWNADAVYCLTALFPAEGEADFGAAFDAMAESFELMQ